MVAPLPRRTLFAVFLGSLAWFAALQVADPRVADPDAYFHIRYAALLAERGPWMEFPWMPHTVFDAGWVDHQWLYHVLLVPFALVGESAFGDLAVGAKASAAVFAAAAVTTFTAVVARRGVSAPWVWALVLLAASRFLTVRLMMPRTQAVSLCLLLAGWGLAVEGRSRALGMLGFVYGWTYHVAAMLVPTVFSAALAPGPAPAAGPRFPLRPTLYAGLGVAAGLLFTPYFPRTAGFFWLHAVEKVGNARGLEVGAEWQPIATSLFLAHVAPAAVVVTAALAGFVLSPRRAQRDTVSAGILLLGWSVAAASSQKWIELMVPFGVLYAALAWRDLRWSVAWLAWAPAVAVVNGLQAVEHVRATVAPAGRLSTIGARLAAEPGAVVHPDWTDFAELYYHAPECTFVVGLDPTFLAAADPGRARLLDGMVHGRVADLSGASRAAWNARWLVITTPGLAAIAEADPGLRRVIDEGGASLWRVRDAP